jgi:hypothetical protein
MRAVIPRATQGSVVELVDDDVGGRVRDQEELLKRKGGDARERDGARGLTECISAYIMANELFQNCLLTLER